MVNVKVRVLMDGRALCIENARRLNANAGLLLEHHGDPNIAFVLWTLAVEEFGKGLLLAEQVTTQDLESIVAVQPNFDHRKSFQRGFAVLEGLEKTTLRRALKVKVSSPVPKVASDPKQPESQLSVPASTTGKFEVVSDPDYGLPPSVELRFDVLYVAWDRNLECWTDGRAGVPEGLVAGWEISETDLGAGIRRLKAALDAA